MFDVAFDWMDSFRPRGKIKLPTEAEIVIDTERAWDDAPSALGGRIPQKVLTREEAWRFEHFRSQGRTLGISPEDRYDEGGERVPECILMIEPDWVGSLWRECFNPEDHHKDGIVVRLVRNRTKRFLLESQGRVESDGRDFDYWALVRIVARRLLSREVKVPSKPFTSPLRGFQRSFFLPRK